MLKNVKIFLDKFYFCIIINFEERKGMVIANGGLMTIEEVAAYLKVTRRTIYEWLKHNKIPAIKLVGQWRFRRDKIEAWIENKFQPQ